MNGTGIMTLLVLTLSIGYVFTYPSFSEIDLLMQEKDKYSRYLSVVTDIEIKKNALLEKFNQISEVDKKNIDTVLPNSFDFVKLIAQIDAVAAGNGILIDRISSRELDSAVGDSIAEAEPSKPYRSALVGFSFNASYDKFNTFMSSLEQSMRILDIKSIRITALPGGQNTYMVEFETYWLKSS